VSILSRLARSLLWRSCYPAPAAEVLLIRRPLLSRRRPFRHCADCRPCRHSSSCRSLGRPVRVGPCGTFYGQAKWRTEEWALELGSAAEFSSVTSGIDLIYRTYTRRLIDQKSDGTRECPCSLLRLWNKLLWRKTLTQSTMWPKRFGCPDR